ncbi:alpha/beta fold hydrolase [Rubrobacter indicoceani]|uniref:alpha/beta fold hydrolase n=1 Tax=Rubrobacter indicoceani TaxID=2051957 RepID=UPI000E5ACA7D|nr:alpha/beta fold hydrolase [Rubrobacter indicoceani]
MSTILIIILLAVLVLLIASLAVGRSTYQVESARDTEYLELEGDWVRYNVIGGGPPVILVHGWLSSSRVWEQLAQRLAQRFTVYTLDLPGFGESDKPADGYGVRYGSRLLFAFCAHFGLTRVNIIGHDLGGDMVMKLASDHPDVVGRIVLVATPANEEQIDLPTSLWAATLPVVGSLFYVLGRSVRPIRSSWMSAFVSEPEDVTEEMIEDSANSTPAAMSKTLSVSKREISGGRLARQARMVRVPVLILTGEEDQIVDPQAAGLWSRSLEQSEVCLMDECGHMPMIERTGEFNAQVLAFLTGDARYLEYAEQSPRQGAPFQTEAEEDTIEVGTVAPEGEDPAFEQGLFSPRSRTAKDEAEEGPGDPEDPARFGGSRSRGTRGRSAEPPEGPGEGDARNSADRLPDNGLSGRPADGDVHEDDREDAASRGVRDQGEAEEDLFSGGVVRRFGERSSRPSVRRRRQPWNFDEPQDAPADRTEDSREPEGSSDLSGFSSAYYANEPETGDADDDRDKGYEGDREGLSDQTTAGAAFSGPSSPEEEDRKAPRTSGAKSFRGPVEPEPAPEQPKVRRRGGGRREGGVPEVPDGLFEWGKSLDDIDFEPVDRSRRRRRASEEAPESSSEPARRDTRRDEGREDDDLRL